MTDCSLTALPGLIAGAREQVVRVRAQRQLARDTFFLSLDCPELAAQIVPGQFFMVRPVTGTNPLLGRPFALYDTIRDGERASGIEFGYVVVGKLTSLMSGWKAGDLVRVWGPLGNGFPTPDADHLMLVAGGIGQTPFLAVARESLGLRRYGAPARSMQRRPRRVTLCYGVRSAEYLAGLEDFASLPGLDVRLATDDGSRGHHGFVTELLAQALESDDPPDCVYCCGPEPMMHAAALVCERAGVRCWLSLESPMACGFGACFSCVTRVKVDDGWDYRRSCVEGPVFRADQLMI